MTPRHLSETMTELASINAILRKKDGRAVRYFMNPNIATHVPSSEQRKEAREKRRPASGVDGRRKDRVRAKICLIFKAAAARE